MFGLIGKRTKVSYKNEIEDELNQLDKDLLILETSIKDHKSSNVIGNSHTDHQLQDWVVTLSTAVSNSNRNFDIEKVVKYLGGDACRKYLAEYYRLNERVQKVLSDYTSKAQAH